MSRFHIAFDSPAWLWLLLLLPAIWWFSFRRLAALGPVRRWVAIALRSAVVLLVVLSLAGVQKVRTSEKMTVIYLLDESVSIPELQRRAEAEYANADIMKHLNKERGDRAGVIVFGRDAALEHPPYDDKIQIRTTPESRIEADHTNIEGALKLAMASFPEDSARRVVIVTDGNENLGSGLEQARQMAEAGVGIDVVPIRYQARADVAVERVTIPPDVNRGQPFDVQVVLNNTATDEGAAVKGQLELVRKTADGEQVMAREAVELAPGKTVKHLRQEIDAPDFYTYEARFVPDNPADDAVSVNNRATTFTHVRGQGQVLLIENWEQDARGEFDFLVDRLRKENLQVTVRPSDQLYSSLAELQPFDTVILADVPREDFSEAQIKMLVRNTHEMGSGLVMLGGPNSFGAGGWSGTELEEAMPVDFQIKNKQVAPIGALAMLMHASEMANGNYWQKKIADAALGTLGVQDYCGVMHWEGTDQWLWTAGGANGIVKIGDEANRAKMKRRIDQMTPGDMPAFDSSLLKMLNDLNTLPPEVAVKHAIVISDGDPSPPAQTILQGFIKAKIKITTVGTGTHGIRESTSLSNIATSTGGKYYQPTSPNALPRIYQKEARVVSQPLIFERESGFSPQEAFPHEMLKGIEGTIPPITGYVLTNKKDNPLVETALISPVGPTAATEANRTILAGWTYGLGKSVALTTDAGKRWASDWTHWDDYDKLFSQIVRWSMRPSGDQGKFTVNTDLADGKVRVTVTALDKNDEFLNFLNMGGSVVGPDMKPIDLKIRQTAPGRYVGEFTSPESGSYFLMLSPGAGMAPILSGVNVPYSPEYLDRETNEGLVKALASLVTKGSGPGELIEDRRGRGTEALLQFDPYRHNLMKASSSQDIWHLLMLAAAGLFFADVFVRRVQISFAWLPPLLAKVRDFVLRREAAPVPIETIERLRSRKAAIAQQIEAHRAATRFEPTPDAPAPGADTLGEIGGTAASAASGATLPTRKSTAPASAEQAEQEDEYTSRLLRAKKQAIKDRKDGGPK